MKFKNADEMLTIDDVTERMCEMGYEDAGIFVDPDYAKAIVGYTDDGRVVYSYEGICQCLMDDNDMEWEEAMEFVDYNVVRTVPYMGERAPIIIYSFE